MKERLKMAYRSLERLIWFTTGMFILLGCIVLIPEFQSSFYGEDSTGPWYAQVGFGIVIFMATATGVYWCIHFGIAFLNSLKEENKLGREKIYKEEKA